MTRSSSIAPPQDIIACTAVHVQYTKGLLTACISSASRERALSPIQCGPDVVVVTAGKDIPRDDPFIATVSKFDPCTQHTFCMLHSNEEVNAQNGTSTKISDLRINYNANLLQYSIAASMQTHTTWSETKQISCRYERWLPQHLHRITGAQSRVWLHIGVAWKQPPTYIPLSFAGV
jgi:hypothetical protein